MKFNDKYKRYVSTDGLVYKVINGVLVQCKIYNLNGYELCSVHGGKQFVHRIVYETFVGEIPKGYDIDHINSVRNDNRVCNLQQLTHRENILKCKNTGFVLLFEEHYHMTSRDDHKLYLRELMYYKRHNNTCRWQIQ